MSQGGFHSEDLYYEYGSMSLLEEEIERCEEDSMADYFARDKNWDGHHSTAWHEDDPDFASIEHVYPDSDPRDFSYLDADSFVTNPTLNDVSGIVETMTAVASAFRKTKSPSKKSLSKKTPEKSNNIRVKGTFPQKPVNMKKKNTE